MRLVLSALVAVGLALPPALHAQEPEPVGQPASTARLGLLTTHDRALLAPHLARGPIAFIEFAIEAELPAIVLAVEVDAPPATIAEVLSDPSAYPRFMPALDSVALKSRRGELVAWDWTWRAAVFTLRGQNVMTVYPAPGEGGRRDRPHRIAIDSTGGDLGTGRMMWRIYPHGEGRSLLVLSSRLDMRDANWLSRQISSGGNSINRSINISIGFVMLLGTKGEAERRLGRRHRASRDLPALRRPEVDMIALAPMLDRGDLVLMDLHGDRIAQATVVGRMGQTRERTREVMTSPDEFGSSLVPGSRAAIVGRDGAGVLFEWSIPLPLVGTEGRMRLEDTGAVIAVDAVEGSLAGGQWRFDTFDYPWGEAAVIGWGRFDPADTSWLIRRVIDGSPYFRHGLVAASQVMVMRSIRNRVWREQ